MAQAATPNIHEQLTSTASPKGSKLDPTDFSPENIRNICILAHVDHGKTCIADCLLTLNGLVNKRSTGTTKYLDNRPDEQYRRITLKSSAVSIGFNLDQTNEEKPVPVLINLVDTPGHVDFNTEVIAATRICDGGLIVVDIIEGVSPQTRTALKYAYEEKLDMILIINKFDRLIIDLMLPFNDTYLKLVRTIDQCNSYIAFLDELEISTDKTEEEERNYFDPVKGNVIFGSAIDNWGVTLRQIATMYINKFEGETVDSLTKKLWDADFYVSSIDRQIKSGAAEKGIATVFSRLFYGMLVHIYTSLSINQDDNAVPNIINKLGLDVSDLPLKFCTCKMKLKYIMEAWNSLAKTIAIGCYYKVRAPTNLASNKINYLLNVDRYSFCDTANETVQDTVSSMKKCSSKGPPIAYITKLFVDNKGTVPVLNELVNTESPLSFIDNSCSPMDRVISKLKKMTVEDRRVQIIGLVRIYSGEIKSGQELTVLDSDHNVINYLLPQPPYLEHLKQLRSLKIENVFILLGSEYRIVESLKAGYICGITCTEILPPGCATLVDTVYRLPIIKQHRVEPIVYNVVTPVEPNQSLILRAGLQMLQQFDTSLQTFINELGEYILTTAGQVHLDKCLTDLKRNFVDLDLIVSPPIYTLRETVEQSVMGPISKTIMISSFCRIDIELSVVSLPPNLALTVQAYHSILNMIQNQEIASFTDICIRGLNNQSYESRNKTFNTQYYEKVVCKLQNILTDAIHSNRSTLCNTIEVMNIMRVGNSKEYINLIINDVMGFSCNMFSTLDEFDPRVLVYSYIVNAFNLACDVGPICKEPVAHCAFIISELNITGPLNLLVSNDPHISSYITQQMKDLFGEVIMKENFAVMEPFLDASIETELEYLGRVYSEIQKNSGLIVPLDPPKVRGSQDVIVKALIPANDADQFIMGIRKITTGSATVCMSFSHYRIGADVYPKGEPKEKARKDKINTRVDRLVKRVRQRKGIIAYDEVVANAEKQRTLRK